MKWDCCSGLDRRSTEISPHRFGVNSHTECLDPVLMADHFSICLGKSRPLSPNSWHGDAAKAPSWQAEPARAVGAHHHQDQMLSKKLKIEDLCGAHSAGREKTPFFQCAEVHHCCGGSEARGWANPGWAQSCSGHLCRALGIQTCCCSRRRAPSLERLYHCWNTQQQ